MEAKPENKVFIDKLAEQNFRKYKEGDHIIHLYGVCDNILGTWISKKSTDEEANFDSEQFESTLPAGCKINGIILIYNDNVYEDFDEVIKKEIELLKSSNIARSEGIFTFVMKDVLYLDDFDAIGFHKCCLILPDGSETEVESVFTDVYSKMKKEYYFLWSRIPIEVINSSETINNSNDSIEIRLLDAAEKTVNESILSKNNSKFQNYYYFFEDSKVLIDTVHNMDNDSTAHITNLLSKLQLNEGDLEFIPGVKTSSGELIQIKKINLLISDEALIKEHSERKFNLDIGGYLKIQNETNNTFLIVGDSLVSNLKRIVENLIKKESVEERYLVERTIFTSHPFFAKTTDGNKVTNEETLMNKMLISTTKFIPNFKYPAKKYTPTRLVNVHSSIKKEIPEYSRQFTVKGNYEYFHYGQDNVNDKGWGCAYRSLQTLFSWFLMNGFAKEGVKIPSIVDIQTTLVKVGDKESKLIGSNDWIGAFEVSIVLNELLGVESQINFVSSGADLASKGRELAYHFQTHGTPVMIGGGVFAYTILGVEYDRVKGDCLFLILDPHYPGEEDVKTIINKGWCEWKTAALFEKGSFYNMCMPQIPK